VQLESPVNERCVCHDVCLSGIAVFISQILVGIEVGHT